MKHTTFSLVSAVLLALTVSAAPALAGPHGHKNFMKTYDTNADNKVTVDEFKKASDTRFRNMDNDGNGKLTEGEFSDYVRAKREKRKQERFNKTDADNSGSVSKSEYLAAQQQRAERKFKRMDKNSDGALNAEEYTTHKRKHHRKGRGKRAFSRMDKNDDGYATQAESQAAWDNWFSKMDSNGDKIVTQEEVKQAREARRHRSKR